MRPIDVSQLLRAARTLAIICLFKTIKVRLERTHLSPSKGYLEELCKTMFHSYGLPVTVTCPSCRPKVQGPVDRQKCEVHESALTPLYRKRATKTGNESMNTSFRALPFPFFFFLNLNANHAIIQK